MSRGVNYTRPVAKVISEIVNHWQTYLNRIYVDFSAVVSHILEEFVNELFDIIFELGWARRNLYK